MISHNQTIAIVVFAVVGNLLAVVPKIGAQVGMGSICTRIDNCYHNAVSLRCYPASRDVPGLSQANIQTWSACILAAIVPLPLLGKEWVIGFSIAQFYIVVELG